MMNTLRLVLAPSRVEELSPDRSWQLRLDGRRLVVEGDHLTVDPGGTLGLFIHMGQWVFRPQDHPSVSNLRVDGAAVRPRHAVAVGRSVNVSYLDQERPAPGVWVIGRRGTGADREFDDPLLLARHAAVRQQADGSWTVIQQQGSVFVDGVKVSWATLAPGRSFVVGQTVLTVPLGSGASTPAARREVAAAGALGVSARALTVANGDRIGLDGVDFDLAPGSLVAVIGPSGAGKSTLIKALMGGRRIVGGQLRVGGTLIGPDADRRLLQQLVRYVPQADDVYGDLTVGETLEFAARLRGAADITDAEVRTRVAKVMADLGLDSRRDARVGTLSGGERRRVSIGIELTANPRLLLLDEPTSGLDLGNDRRVMDLLHKISRDGCTVVVITHNVEHLDRADKVMIIASGGRIGFFGDPAEARVAIGQHTWADLLDHAAREAPGQPARARPPVRDVLPRPDRARPGSWVRSPGRALSHLATVAGREVLLLRRRGVLSVLALASMPAIGVAVAILASRHGLSPSLEVTQVLSIMVTIAALGGAAITYQEIVSQQGTLVRDWRIGTGSVALVTAKGCVFTLVCAVLAVVMVGLFHAFRPGFAEAYSLHPMLAELLVWFLVMTASMGLGLLISAAAATLELAVTVNAGLAILQVVLNGALFELPGPIRWASLALPARLGFAATASYGDLNQVRQGQVYVDRFWQHDEATFWLLIAGLAVVAVGSLAASATVLEWRWRRRELSPRGR